MPAGTGRGGGIRILFIAAAIAGTTLGHYYTPSSLILWHNIFQRLYYLPIVYAAVVFGWKGGLLASVISGLCYVPHIVTAWRDFPGYVINQYAEIVLFLLVGIAAGLAADEQRAKQAELERTAEQLARANRELHESFERLKRADRLAAVGNLSAGLAHEIRNPLAGIEGAAGILEQKGLTEEQRLEFLGIIRKECGRLNRLLGNLLDFARPAAPQRRTQRVDALLDSAVELIAHGSAGRAISLRTDLEPPDITVEGDGEQLKQVILNLLLNAAQSMPQGGEIRLSARCRGSHVLIEVSDQGCGIPPENMDKMFNPFFTTKEAGTGLGLAVAHQIVAQHGGTLRARNNPERGATFSIQLPRTQQ